jgi:cyclophilin family peptidyl-prolyl cis-trans isomerase/HEAT repeat protein
VSLDRKLGWIIRLEQQRVLHDAPAPVAPPSAAPPAASTAPAAAPDLERLVRDGDAAVRARAALAIGRVALIEGESALRQTLQDPDPNVRASAAFALGLLASKASEPALTATLQDASVLVRGKAIEALGLIGDTAAARAVSGAAAGCSAVLAPLAPDDEEWPKSPEVEVCRLALFALVRLKDYDALAQVVLDAQGQPVSRWWPVAYALQRIGDVRAAPALLALASTPGVNTATFALRGLAALKSAAVAPLAPSIAARHDVDVKVRVAAVRAIAQVGGPADVPLLTTMLNETDPGSPLGLEVFAALGLLHQPQAFDAVADELTNHSPAVRAAALTAAARIDPDKFLLVLSGLGRDPDWTVRSALAAVLATLPADRVTSGLVDLADDEDARVHGPALEALAAVKAPVLRERLLTALEAPDFVERATAARLMGDGKIDGGVPALVAAYGRGESDAAYGARAAVLDALAKYGGDDAMAALRRGLSDRAWPVRVRAAELLGGLGQTAVPERPAPTRLAEAVFESAALLHPAFSPHAFIETRYGVIEVQLNVIDAPITTQTFIEQVRAGFFTGMKVHRLVPAFVLQAGDPRGDGEGGPGYTIPDELNGVPYLRGTMGMALDWHDTGGSQWFITLTPQPHLDAKYTSFGRVVKGWEVLDQIAPWDVIERIRIWDGVELK